MAKPSLLVFMAEFLLRLQEGLEVTSHAFVFSIDGKAEMRGVDLSSAACGALC